MTGWDSKPDEHGMHKVPLGRQTARRLKSLMRPGETENDALRRVLDMTDAKGAPFAQRTLEGAHGQWPAPDPSKLKIFPSFPSLDDMTPEQWPAAAEAANKIAEALRPIAPHRRRSVLSKAEAAFSGKGFKIDLEEGSSCLTVNGKAAVVPNSAIVAAVDEAITKKNQARRAELAEQFAHPTLEKLGESFWHKITEAWANGTAFHLFEGDLMVKAEPTFLAVPKVLQSFVVQHDWSAAFAKATDFEGGEFRLPYEAQVFEFRVSGRRVAVSVIAEGGAPISAMLYLEFSGGFILGGMYRWEHGAWVFAFRGLIDCVAGVMELCGRQIRAVAIALEAEVAVTEVVRAPHKLNARRERKGKSPLLDFHTISLANRHRTARPLEHAVGERAKVRLHFRRGHWRHFATSKTWINWMLVGDPELGFIDKQYRL